MVSLRKQTYQCAIWYKLKKIVTTHDGKNTQVCMFLRRNVRVGINNLAGIPLVPCKQHMLLIETLKSFDSAVVISK